jgi:hypothetical protein
MYVYILLQILVVIFSLFIDQGSKSVNSSKWNWGKLNDFQDVYVMMCWTCDYVITNGKRDFAKVIKLKSFYLEKGLWGWAPCHHKDS